MNRIKAIANEVLGAGVALLFAIGIFASVFLFTAGFMTMSQTDADTTQVLQGWSMFAAGVTLGFILAATIPTNKK